MDPDVGWGSDGRPRQHRGPVRPHRAGLVSGILSSARDGQVVLLPPDEACCNIRMAEETPQPVLEAVEKPLALM